MPITVQHQPSMVLIGQAALQAGRASYLDRLRQEQQRSQLARDEMTQNRQMQNQRISADFALQQNQQKLLWDKMAVENTINRQNATDERIFNVQYLGMQQAAYDKRAREEQEALNMRATEGIKAEEKWRLAEQKFRTEQSNWDAYYTDQRQIVNGIWEQLSPEGQKAANDVLSRIRNVAFSSRLDEKAKGQAITQVQKDLSEVMANPENRLQSKIIKRGGYQFKVNPVTGEETNLGMDMEGFKSKRQWLDHYGERTPTGWLAEQPTGRGHMQLQHISEGDAGNAASKNVSSFSTSVGTLIDSAARLQELMAAESGNATYNPVTGASGSSLYDTYSSLLTVVEQQIKALSGEITTATADPTQPQPRPGVVTPVQRGGGPNARSTTQPGQAATRPAGPYVTRDRMFGQPQATPPAAAQPAPASAPPPAPSRPNMSIAPPAVRQRSSGPPLTQEQEATMHLTARQVYRRIQQAKSRGQAPNPADIRMLQQLAQQLDTRTTQYAQ